MEAYNEIGRAAREKYPSTPAEHAGLLHPLKAKGWVTVARKLPNVPRPRNWKEDNWQPYELENVLADVEGQTDTYMSQNRFRGEDRAIAQVLELCGLYSDVDYYKVPELRGLSAEAVLEKVLERLREAGIPEPSMVLFSGRGLYLTWWHAPVAGKLAEWNACQDRIYRVLKPLGADSVSREAARVLRIAGTTNSKTGAIVRSLGEPAEKVYRFEDLAEALVKNAPESEESSADLYSIAVQRASRGLRTHPQGWSETSLWEGRLTDLQHLRRMRYGEGPMKDYRDRWLFIATTAISWLVVPGVLDREALALAKEAGGWDERRTRSDLSQVLKRARRAARGETIEFAGREWDPRHHFKDETIIDWLEITPEEELEMVVTISPEEDLRRRRDRGREYRRRKRRAEGTPTRDEYDRQRAALAKQRAAVARQLAKCNVPTSEIAERMGVSPRTVQRWLK